MLLKISAMQFFRQFNKKIHIAIAIENVIKPVNTMKPVLVIHGGAGDIPNKKLEVKLAGIKKAVNEAFKVLEVGGSALDAVEAAVMVMESDENFNAGRGSVLNLDGKVEMDALIMDGKTLKCGAVGAVKNIEHPITLAHLVLSHTPHAFLVGEGANRFAKQMGISPVSDEFFITDNQKDLLEKFKRRSDNVLSKSWYNVDTVGAVALDDQGNLAAATSTGGTTGKMVGRVGDSPIPGAGGYADNEIGAVSTTGLGEAIMSTCLSFSILNKMKLGSLPKDAAQASCELMTARTAMNGTGGAIVISKKGEIGIGFSANRMVWASRTVNKLRYGVEKNQDIKETVN